MDRPRALLALTSLGARLTAPGCATVEVLIVGASAGVLTGQLPRGRTTVDCDVMVIAPAGAGDDLAAAAELVARELGLPARWFNTDVQMLRHALPAGWEGRRVPVVTSGALRVHAIGRLDLVAMKVYAGRAQDLEDLRSMAPSTDERRFVASYIEALAAAGEPDGYVADARAVLDALGGTADAG